LSPHGGTLGDDFVLAVIGKSAEIKVRPADSGIWIERKTIDP
jgi:hypothetical protein